MSNNYKVSYNDQNHYVMTFDSFNSGVIKSKVSYTNLNVSFLFCLFKKSFLLCFSLQQ